MGEGEGEATPIVTPVVETESHLTEPLIDHAGKIAHIEERQSQHELELVRQLGDLETRLQSATGSQVSAISERIAALEAKIEAMAPPPVEEAEDIPDEAVEFAEPEVEPSPAPPEKVRKGLRHRRKARRGK
jgi:hypothetical protein